MNIGVMARTFVRPTLEETLDASAAFGLMDLQFSLSCAGLPEMPDEIPVALCDRVREEVERRGMNLSAISGTFNMIHPNPEERKDGLRRLRTLAESCDRLGTSLITLCTGTRDPDYMWRRHPDNDSSDAWMDLTETMEEALVIAEDSGVLLGVEPEVSNVIDSAMKARLLLDEMTSPNLKIVIDGANLYHAGEMPQMDRILKEAFDLLGGEIALAHGKDVSKDGEAGHDAAGTGLLNYDLYLSLLQKTGYEGAVILHSLAESQVEFCIGFLKGKLSAL